MTQICYKCSEEVSCPNCNNFKSSIQLIMELSKSIRKYGELSEKYEITKKFIRGIVHDWECDPNHASAILNDLENLNKKGDF